VCYEGPMRGARAGGLLAAVAVCVLVAGSARATTVKGIIIYDKAKGYALTIPAAWKPIPRTEKEVQQTIATLKKKKSTVALAKYYQSIISTAQGRSGLSAYRFQAFAWPVPANASPLPTEVSLEVAPLPKPLTASDFPKLGAAFANNLAAQKGARVTVPKIVTLPAGKAEFIEATIPAGEGLQYGFELYLIPHGKRLYNLTFQIDARYLKQAALFKSIAQQFKLV
jgi:hypothetical protein